MSLPPYPSVSLYVGDLLSEVAEVHLFEAFVTCGQVASVRVCRDAVTRRSLGYAYVNFHHPQDAENAMETLNNTQIKGKLCRIMWSQRDPSIRKSGVGNIFIKNLEKSIDHKSLQDTFSAFGNILSCKVDTDENGNSKGFGFVHFENQESADQAIEKVNNMSILGQTVYVARFVPKRERIKNREEQGFTNLYVKNFDDHLEEEGLRNLFSPFGEILSSTLVVDGSKKSKGFGFVSFKQADDAKKACNSLNGITIGSKILYVSRAQKKTERLTELKTKFKTEMANKYQGVNLYVKNLSDEVDDQKLREEFSPFGSITSLSVMKDDRGNSKGFGFVCYSSPEEASKACVEMNTRIVGTKPIYVALAQRKEERRSQLISQNAQRLKSMSSGVPVNGNIYSGSPFYLSQPPINQYVYPQMPIQQQQQAQQHHQQNRRGWVNHQQFPQLPVIYPVARHGRHNYSRQPQVNRNRGGHVGSRKENNSQVYDQHPIAQPHQPQQQHQAQQPVSLQDDFPRSNVPDPTIEEKKNELGEKLFALIDKVDPDHSGKITGMLIESLTPDNLLNLLHDQAALNESITEALIVLDKAQV